MQNNLAIAILADNEVFDILDFDYAPEDQKNRVINGFNNNPTGLDITGLKGIGLGSRLVSGGFDNSFLISPPHMNKDDKNVYAFLSEDKVFLIVAIAKDNKEKAEVWENAFKTEVTGIIINNRDTTKIGDFWDGTNFVKSTNSNKETPWQTWKKNLGTTRPWDIINPQKEKVSEDESNRRLDICKQCPELIQVTNQCKKCGCIMPIKVKLKEAVCPIGKW